MSEHNDQLFAMGSRGCSSPCEPEQGLHNPNQGSDKEQVNSCERKRRPGSLQSTSKSLLPPIQDQCTLGSEWRKSFDDATVDTCRNVRGKLNYPVFRSPSFSLVSTGSKESVSVNTTLNSTLILTCSGQTDSSNPKSEPITPLPASVRRHSSTNFINEKGDNVIESPGNEQNTLSLVSLVEMHLPSFETLSGKDNSNSTQERNKYKQTSQARGMFDSVIHLADCEESSLNAVDHNQPRKSSLDQITARGSRLNVAVLQLNADESNEITPENRYISNHQPRSATDDFRQSPYWSQTPKHSSGRDATTSKQSGEIPSSFSSRVNSSAPATPEQVTRDRLRRLEKPQQLKYYHTEKLTIGGIPDLVLQSDLLPSSASKPLKNTDQSNNWNDDQHDCCDLTIKNKYQRNDCLELNATQETVEYDSMGNVNNTVSKINILHDDVENGEPINRLSFTDVSNGSKTYLYNKRSSTIFDSSRNSDSTISREISFSTDSGGFHSSFNNVIMSQLVRKISSESLQPDLDRTSARIRRRAKVLAQSVLETSPVSVATLSPCMKIQSPSTLLPERQNSMNSLVSNNDSLPLPPSHEADNIEHDCYINAEQSQNSPCNQSSSKQDDASNYTNTYLTLSKLSSKYDEVESTGSVSPTRPLVITTESFSHCDKSANETVQDDEVTLASNCTAISEELTHVEESNILTGLADISPSIPPISVSESSIHQPAFKELSNLKSDISNNAEPLKDKPMAENTDLKSSLCSKEFKTSALRTGPQKPEMKSKKQTSNAIVTSLEQITPRKNISRKVSSKPPTLQHMPRVQSLPYQTKMFNKIEKKKVVTIKQEVKEQVQSLPKNSTNKKTKSVVNKLFLNGSEPKSGEQELKKSKSKKTTQSQKKPTDQQTVQNVCISISQYNVIKQLKQESLIRLEEGNDNTKQITKLNKQIGAVSHYSKKSHKTCITNEGSKNNVKQTESVPCYSKTFLELPIPSKDNVERKTKSNQEIGTEASFEPSTLNQVSKENVKLTRKSNQEIGTVTCCSKTSLEPPTSNEGTKYNVKQTGSVPNYSKTSFRLRIPSQDDEKREIKSSQEIGTVPRYSKTFLELPSSSKQSNDNVKRIAKSDLGISECRSGKSINNETLQRGFELTSKNIRNNSNIIEKHPTIKTNSSHDDVHRETICKNNDNPDISEEALKTKNNKDKSTSVINNDIQQNPAVRTYEHMTKFVVYSKTIGNAGDAYLTDEAPKLVLIEDDEKNPRREENSSPVMNCEYMTNLNQSKTVSNAVDKAHSMIDDSKTSKEKDHLPKEPLDLRLNFSNCKQEYTPIYYHETFEEVSDISHRSSNCYDKTIPIDQDTPPYSYKFVQYTNKAEKKPSEISHISGLQVTPNPMQTMYRDSPSYVQVANAIYIASSFKDSLKTCKETHTVDIEIAPKSSSCSENE